MTQPPLSAEAIQAILESSPYMRFARMRVAAADPANETLTLTAPLVPEHERGYNDRQWHGGTIAALIDAAGDFALVIALGRPLPTIHLSVEYLRPAIDTALTATARVRRQGRTVGVVDVDVTNEAGTLVAIGRATYATG